MKVKFRCRQIPPCRRRRFQRLLLSEESRRKPWSGLSTALPKAQGIGRLLKTQTRTVYQNRLQSPIFIASGIDVADFLACISPMEPPNTDASWLYTYTRHPPMGTVAWGTAISSAGVSCPVMLGCQCFWPLYRLRLQQNCSHQAGPYAAAWLPQRNYHFPVLHHSCYLTISKQRKTHSTMPTLIST